MKQFFKVFLFGVLLAAGAYALVAGIITFGMIMHHCGAWRSYW